MQGGGGPLHTRRLVTFARHVVQTDTCSPAVSGQETRHVQSGGGTTAHPLRGFREGIALPSRASPFEGRSGHDGDPLPRGAPWETANAWRSARSSPTTLIKQSEPSSTTTTSCALAIFCFHEKKTTVQQWIHFGSSIRRQQHFSVLQVRTWNSKLGLKI